MTLEIREREYLGESEKEWKKYTTNCYRTTNRE